MKSLVNKITISILILSAHTYGQTASIVYQNTVNSVVTIETDLGTGSGFFVSNNLVATNFHVIEGASNAIIILNSTSQTFKVEGFVAKDEKNDLAILKVSYLSGVPLKFATNNIKQGDDILAIGSPKGIPATISKGIISNLNSEMKLIQIDASISHGSSGGPVLNLNGEVIGVAVGAIENGQNLNFAIPVRLLENLLNFKSGYVTKLSAEETSPIKSNKDEIKNEPTEELCEYLNASDTNLDLSYIKNLIFLGANVNSSSKHGFTSLMEAAYQNDINFAKLLITRGAEVNAESTGGFTPIHYAQTEEIKGFLKSRGGH